jgi:hypothetical protein
MSKGNANKQSNSNGIRKITRRPNKVGAVVGWVEASPNIRYRIFTNLGIPKPIKVLKNLVLSGSTGVTTATSTNTSVGVQTLSVAQINNFSTRFAGFREYLLKGLRIVIQPVSQVGTSAGTVAFWLDEASSTTPTSTALDNIPHASMPVIQENSRALEIIWSAHDLSELTWQLLANAEPISSYLKWYGDGGNTALVSPNGSQLFMIDYYFTIDFRGYA